MFLFTFTWIPSLISNSKSDCVWWVFGDLLDCHQQNHNPYINHWNLESWLKLQWWQWKDDFPKKSKTHPSSRRSFRRSQDGFFVRAKRCLKVSIAFSGSKSIKTSSTSNRLTRVKCNKQKLKSNVWRVSNFTYYIRNGGLLQLCSL